RHTKADVLDYFAGVELHKVKGDAVKPDDVVMELYASKPIDEAFAVRAQQAITYSEQPVDAIDAKSVLKSKDLSQ
ncbi:MAG TPA: hypothetical protein VIH12_06895, partial [Solibacillus sp.]